MFVNADYVAVGIYLDPFEFASFVWKRGYREDARAYQSLGQRKYVTQSYECFRVRTPTTKHHLFVIHKIYRNSSELADLGLHKNDY